MMTAVHSKFKLNNSQLINESQDYIKSMMSFLKDNTGFKSYFA